MPEALILCEFQHLHSSNPRMLPYNTGREIPIPRIRGGDPVVKGLRVEIFAYSPHTQG